MIRALVATVAILASTGCTHAGKDQAKLIRATLDRYGPGSVIVLPAELSEVTKNAARSVGRTVAQTAVPRTPEWTLPPGYFVLQRVEISRAEGAVAGLVGPVPAPKPGVGMLACGRRVLVRFSLVDGQWQPGETQELIC